MGETIGTSFPTLVSGISPELSPVPIAPVLLLVMLLLALRVAWGIVRWILFSRFTQLVVMGVLAVVSYRLAYRYTTRYLGALDRQAASTQNAGDGYHTYR